ncbi:thermonuclease family protein [Hydrogenophaga sp. UC242_53]|uniref:thermonuclease family protein n=1 Tax=Hydrogenophaga sp. UC242_53 TaxID=3350170 RepID=UPI0036D21946
MSRQHLAALCFQQAARIAPKGTDRYKRTIADVECRGKDAGQEQIRAGQAWYYVKFGKRYEHLAQVEQQARDAGLGVWSMKAVPPWEWRRQ